MNRIISKVTLLFLFLLLQVLVPSQAQEDTRNIIYVCIFNGDTSYIMKVRASEPIGLVFAEETNVIVYSSADAPLVVRVIHIISDTTTGTYKRARDVVSANTTSNIPDQGNCEQDHSSLPTGLERTILLPVSSDQAIAIYSQDIKLYQDEPTAIIGAIGLIPRATVDNEEQSPFPSFQILRFSGGDSDKVSLEFPELEGETEFYTVSRQLVSHTETNTNGDTSLSDPMETRTFFLSLLDSRNISLIDDIMAKGKFRMFIEFGDPIMYRAGFLLNFARLSSFTSRTFEVGDKVIPIDCSYDLSYIRKDDYNHYIYFDDRINSLSVGKIRCDRSGTVEKVRDDGILIVDGGYAIAAWLLEVDEEQ